jgi:hypothetical protein
MLEYIASTSPRATLPTSPRSRLNTAPSIPPHLIPTHRPTQHAKHNSQSRPTSPRLSPPTLTRILRVISSAHASSRLGHPLTHTSANPFSQINAQKTQTSTRDLWNPSAPSIPPTPPRKADFAYPSPLQLINNPAPTLGYVSSHGRCGDRAVGRRNKYTGPDKSCLVLVCATRL